MILLVDSLAYIQFISNFWKMPISHLVIHKLIEIEELG